MAKAIRSEVPVVFQLQEDRDHFMIASQVGNSMNLVKGALYKRYLSLWRRYVTTEERELLSSMNITCNNQSMLVKANEIDDIAVDNGSTIDEADSERETEGEDESSSLTPKNADGSPHPFGNINIESVFNDILNELRSLKSESEIQRKEILNLKHRDACQCLKDQVESLKKDNQKLVEENEQLRERNTNLSYIMSDLNTKVKEVENEKQSLVTALKILHGDHVNESANRFRGIAQVDHQSSGEHKSRRISGRSSQPCVQTESFNDLNKFLVFRIDDDDDGDEEIRIITDGKHTQMALKPSMSKKSTKDISSGSGSSVTHKAVKSATESKSDDKRLVFIAGDSIVQHVHGWELCDSKQRVAVKSFSGSKIEDMADYLKLLMRKTPDEIIVHVGTNDVKDDTKSAEVVAAGILNLGNQIKDNLPNTKVSISSLIVRKDKTSVLNKINNINVILKRVCEQNNWTYIDHNNIDYSCLNRHGLHLNRKGSSLVSKNFSQFLNT